MRFKRFSAMLLALAMCMGVFSTTVFAYSDESATTTTTEKAETVETVPEKTEDKTSEELPYTVTVNEDARWFSLSMAKSGFMMQRNPRIITWELARW